MKHKHFSFYVQQGQYVIMWMITPLVIISLNIRSLSYLYAVSYTHLDVYKRQIYIRFIRIVISRITVSALTVCSNHQMKKSEVYLGSDRKFKRHSSYNSLKIIHQMELVNTLVSLILIIQVKIFRTVR